MKKLRFDKIYIPQDVTNEVTSNHIFQSRKIVDKYGNYLYHEEGIFSDKIFGNIGRCECGNLTKPGFCNHCQTRVVDESDLPLFYIPFFNMVDIPYIDINFEGCGANPDLVYQLMFCHGFLYEGDYYQLNLLELDLTQFDYSKILIGKEAILSLGVSEEWYNKNTHHQILVTHRSYREPIAQPNGEVILTDISECYVRLLNRRNKLLNYLQNDYDIIQVLIARAEILEAVTNLYGAFFRILSQNKKNIVDESMNSQRITGAIRGVIINNYSLDEDDVLIGSYFAKTMYPELFHQLNGDLDEMNNYLESREFLVLGNRQPTIGAKSVMAFRPKFSKEPNERYVIQFNPIIFDGFAADVDGDVMMLIPLYTKASNIEARKLLSSVNYIEGSNDTIRNNIPKEFGYIKDKYNFELKDPIDRKELMKVYRSIGKNMFKLYSTPTVADFIHDISENSLVSSVGDGTDALVSVARINDDYSNLESDEYIKSVVAANVTDITESGHLYKKCMSATDSMEITHDDCGSNGIQMSLPITEEVYNFRVKYHFITELDEYTQSYYDFIEKTKDLPFVHVRTFLGCNTKHTNKFCAKCAGIFKRHKDDSFIPRKIGMYATLMVTEKATQSSLDSMNKGVTTKIVDQLETKIDKNELQFYGVDQYITNLVDAMVSSGVESRFLEIIFLSRILYNDQGNVFAKSLAHVMVGNEDDVGVYIYRPIRKHFDRMLSKNEITLSSNKSKIAFDIFDDE